MEERSKDNAHAPTLRSISANSQGFCGGWNLWEGQERGIGSIGRECLDHVIVLNERHLHRVLTSYFDYYHRSRTHLSLEKDCPEPRPVHPPDAGKVIAFPEVGGLHHRYVRLAA